MPEENFPRLSCAAFISRCSAGSIPFLRSFRNSFSLRLEISYLLALNDRLNVDGRSLRLLFPLSMPSPLLLPLDVEEVAKLVRLPWFTGGTALTESLAAEGG